MDTANDSFIMVDYFGPNQDDDNDDKRQLSFTEATLATETLGYAIIITIFALSSPHSPSPASPHPWPSVPPPSSSEQAPSPPEPQLSGCKWELSKIENSF